jgi:hypothetical protein
MMLPKVATSVLAVPEVAPGAAGFQFVSSAQLPSALMFQVALSAKAVAVASRALPARMRKERRVACCFMVVGG